MASLNIDDFTQDSEEAPEMHCEQCEEFGETAEAEGFCVNCFEYMCKSCLKYHARQNQQHILQDRKTMPQDFCFEQCPVHTNNFIRFYCSVCQKSACIKCRANDHEKCNCIGHVPTLAKDVENGKELKELFKDINFISSELKRTKEILITSIQKINWKKRQEERAIEKKKEDRKLQSAKLQKMLTDKFDRFKTDIITVINKIQVENTAWLTMELDTVDIEQTEKEDQTLASLKKATTTNISKMTSLLATYATLNDGIQTVLSGLTQNKNAAQRCKLFLALKAAVPYTEMQKQKMQELTAALQLTSYLPQLKNQYARDSDNEAMDTQTLSDLPEELDEERLRDLFRRAGQLKCSNTMCGTSGYGTFCQECGHRMVDALNCKDAKHVASKGHKLNGRCLEVSMFGVVYYKNKVLVKGLRSSTSDILFNYIKAKTGLIPETIDYHATQQGVAMITFYDNSAISFSAYEKVQKNTESCGASLEVYPVPLPNCIIVANLNNKISEDQISFYFENKRKSCGGDINDVKMINGHTCLVLFDDVSVIERVLNRSHILCGRTLDVKLYDESLGRLGWIYNNDEVSYFFKDK